MWVLKLMLKKYPWVVMGPILGGSALVGIAMAHTIYQASRYTPPTISIDREENKKTPEARPSLDHYAIIFQQDLFASAISGVEERVKGEGSAVPASTIPFKLKGTVVVSPGVSCAVIEDPATRKQELYHQDEVVYGYKIVKILRNKVIVDKDGQEEVVEVAEEKERPLAVPVKRSRKIKRRPLQRPVKKAPSKGEAPLDLR
ncbi:MAG: hypothetical protein JRI46_10295 [Deltaproteobacteria bacterium]|nr:hypothetical protein [Deltaproteobacteria bacterium]